MLLLFWRQNMTIKLFITGTDTEAGKTYICQGLLKAFHQMRLSALGMKPVASGCRNENGEWVNEDTLALMEASSIKLPHEVMTPFAFQPAIAPHIAARQVRCNLNVASLQEKTRDFFKNPADVFIVEGCGGWHTPLNEMENMSDFVAAQQLDVILVIGIRLGCLNHALLTCEAIENAGVKLIGWIANHIDKNMVCSEENVMYLKEKLRAECLGVIKYGMQNTEEWVKIAGRTSHLIALK